MSRSGSEPVPSSDTRSPTPPLEPQWQWRSFPNPTTNIPRTNDPDQTQEEHAQIQAPESAAKIHAEQAPRPKYERAHAQEPAPESEPAQQEVVDKHQDEVKRVLQELLSESSESPNHMLSQEGPKQSQDQAPESPDHMSSHGDRNRAKNQPLHRVLNKAISKPPCKVLPGARSMCTSPPRICRMMMMI